MDNMEDRGFRCLYCTPASPHKSLGALQTHISTYHKAESRDAREVGRSVMKTCLSCSKSFNSTYYASVHERKCKEKGHVFMLS